MTIPISAGPRHGTEVVSIQYLRALAALGVVLSHASISLFPNGRSLIPMNSGTAGVDIFFVISGFIMYYTTANRKVRTGQFYLRRLIRIAPLYFVFTTLGFLIARYVPIAIRTFSPYISDYILSILFIPYYSRHDIYTKTPTLLVRPVVGQGWTLDYEMFFYLLFGICLYLPVRLRVRSLVGICISLSLAGFLFRPRWAVLHTYTDPLLLEFACGTLISYLYVQHMKIFDVRSRYRAVYVGTGLTLAITAIATLIIENASQSTTARIFTFGLPAVSLVGGMLLMEIAGYIRKLPFLLLLGNASYSLYLLHTFVLALLHRAWQRVVGITQLRSHIGFLIVGSIICEALSIGVFLYLERPMTVSISNVLIRRGILRTERSMRLCQRNDEKQQAVRTSL